MLGRSRTRIPVTFGLMWLVACLPAISSATTPRLWYQAKSRAIELTIATDEIGVRASDLGANSAAAERLGRILPSITLPTEPSSGLARLKLGAPAAGGDEVLRLVGALNDGSRHWVFSPVLRLGNARVVLTGEVLFRLHIDLEQSVLARMLSDVGLFEVRGPLAKYGVITAKLFDDSDPLAVLGASRRLAELPSVEFAHPNFVGALIESVLPNDTYFGSQWQFHNTGQTGGVSGADIQASDAWDVTTGSSSVTVAIVDAGVDITHPEFAGRLVTGYDATDGSNNSQPNAAESHGTACAGLALAAGNNGSGVAGVAWTAKLMPVRVSSNGITTDTQLADGILTAAFRGASVVSCSWEGGTPSPTLEFAINSALKNGRAGKGCVVVFASGDAGGGVGYPARLPGVISVGATNASDVRWSYSNFGPELTMVAPSGNHLTGAGLWTTDNRGSAGANPGSASLGDAAGDYTNQFDGTSAACPLVAGAAALALSVNGDLTASQVQATLTASATDLGAPGRDDQYGAGRLNVRAALGLLTSSVAVSGTLDANTVWHRGNVYKVLSDVFVPAGITLTIDAGTVINFEPGRLLSVGGMLVSEGTVADPVVFTSYRDDSYGGDTNLDGASTGGAGDWQGVVLSGGNYTLQHCLLRYGGTYTLFNNAYGALVANGGFTGTIANNVVYAAYSGSAGILVSSSCTVSGNTVTGVPSLSYGVRCTDDLSCVVNGNVITNAATGITVSASSSALIVPSIQQNLLRACNVSIAASGGPGTNFVPLIKNNDIDTCGTGIMLSYGNPNTNVTDNAVRNASAAAILLSHGNAWVQRNICAQSLGWAGTGSGIRIEGGQSFSVTDNLVNAFHADVYVGPSGSEVGSVDCRRNHILNAGSRGVWRDASPSMNAASLTVVGNDLYGSADYDLYLSPSADGPTTTVDATGNWWGTTDPSRIASKVFDRSDNGASALANVSGSLSAPITADDPSLGVAPTSISTFAFTNGGTDASLLVSNTGIRTLNFQIDEAAGGQPNGATQATRSSFVGTDLPWVSEGPVSGSIVGATSQHISVHFDGTAVQDGSYSGSLVLSSNDPSSPLFAVPISLTVAHVRVDAPQPGQSFQPGQNFSVRWATAPSQPASTIDLALSTDGGHTYGNLVTGLVDAGEATLVVPLAVSDSCRIRVTGHYPDSSTHSGYSAGFFAITGVVFVSTPIVQAQAIDYPSGEAGEGVNTALGTVTRRFEITTLRGPGEDIPLVASYTSNSNRSGLLGPKWVWTLGQALDLAPDSSATAVLNDW